MLEAMVLLERQGRIRGGGYSGRQKYDITRRNAADANSFGEFIRVFWKNLISGVELLFKSKLVIAAKKDSVKIPLIIALLMIIVINLPMAIAVMISIGCGCRYSVEIKR